MRQEIWEPPSNLLRPQCHHPLSECEAAAAVYQSICRRCVLPHTDRAATLPGSSCGLLREDYSNSHDAVGSTMTPWYRWYHTIQPDETEVAKVKKTYKTYLK